LSTRHAGVGAGWRRFGSSLAVIAVSLSMSGCSWWPFGKKDTPEPVIAGENMPDQVIDPNIARRDIVVPAIDTEQYEVGAFAGTLATTRDNSLGVFGVRAGMFFTEDFFGEWSFATSLGGKNDSTGPESGDPVKVDSFGVSLGYNLLPLELFNGETSVMPAWIYVLGGAAQTSYDDESFVSGHFAIGMRVMPADHWSVRVEIRNELWPASGDESKGSVNLQYTFGVGYAF
jgi:outer membrane beta-barrel protein